jgi:hypothetical protein
MECPTQGGTSQWPFALHSRKFRFTEENSPRHKLKTVLQLARSREHWGPNGSGLRLSVGSHFHAITSGRFPDRSGNNQNNEIARVLD